MKQRLILGIVVAVLFANVFLMMYVRQRNTVALEHNFQIPAHEAFDGAIRRLVEPLRGQSLEESLNMLDRIQYYEFSAPLIESRPFTLDDGGRYQRGLDRQNVILSNRAFRKCLQEIKLLSPREAALLIERHLDSALSAYIAAYESAANPWLLSEGEDGKPVFQGLRYRVWALLLIAGTSELTNSHEAIRKVANVALEQKRDMPEFEDPFLQLVYLTQESLWNPHILSAGLFGTHPHRDSPEFSDIARRFSEHQIVDYTARRNEFESIAFIAVEPDKEYIKLRFFEEATDDDVLRLLGIANE